jgi:hypothetical protein
LRDCVKPESSRWHSLTTGWEENDAKRRREDGQRKDAKKNEDEQRQGEQEIDEEKRKAAWEQVRREISCPCLASPMLGRRG